MGRGVSRGPRWTWTAHGADPVRRADGNPAPERPCAGQCGAHQRGQPERNGHGLLELRHQCQRRFPERNLVVQGGGSGTGTVIGGVFSGTSGSAMRNGVTLLAGADVAQATLYGGASTTANADTSGLVFTPVPNAGSGNMLNVPGWRAVWPCARPGLPRAGQRSAARYDAGEDTGWQGTQLDGRGRFADGEPVCGISSGRDLHGLRGAAFGLRGRWQCLGFRGRRHGSQAQPGRRGPPA